MGRKYIGIELKPEYAKQAAKFLQAAEQQSGSLLELITDTEEETA
jgi:DNA modification methylase